MNPIRHAAIVLLLIATAPFAFTQSSEGSSTTSQQASKPASPKSPQDRQQLEKMDQQLKAMREMHDKMMAAKTPEERNALMAEHMKTMQNSMSMMRGMNMMGGRPGDNQPMPPQMMQDRMEKMQKQMDMMQMTMQLMMDRMGMTTPSK